MSTTQGLHKPNIVKFNICDTDPEKPSEKILSSWFLVDPDMDKLEELKAKLKRRIEDVDADEEFEGIWDIESYILDTFETIEIEDFEVPW